MTPGLDDAVVWPNEESVQGEGMWRTRVVNMEGLVEEKRLDMYCVSGERRGLRVPCAWRAVLVAAGRLYCVGREFWGLKVELVEFEDGGGRFVGCLC